MATEKSEDAGRERDRFRGRGRGAFVQFYEDMGTSSTEEGHSKFVESKAAWDKQVAAEQARVAAARARVNEAQSLYNTQNAQLQNGYSQFAEAANAPVKLGGSFNEAYNKGTTQVVVVSGKGNTAEGSYRLGGSPKEIYSKLSSQGLTANIGADGKVYVHSTVQGRTVGGELHSSLLSAHTETQKSAKSEYDLAYSEAMKVALGQKGAELNKAQVQLNAAQGRVSDFASQIAEGNASVSAAEASVGASKGLMAEQLNKIKASHKEREGVIREIFTDMGVEMGEYKLGEEFTPVIPAEKLAGIMKERGIPEAAIQTDGKVDNDKVEILTTFLVEQLLAEKEMGEGKEGGGKYVSTYERAVGGTENAS